MNKNADWIIPENDPVSIFIRTLYNVYECKTFRLLNSNGFGEVARLIHVAITGDGNMVC